MHPVVVVCLVALLLGIGLALKWGHLQFEPPPPAETVTFGEQAKRVVWYLDILMIGGVVAGLLAAGAGGRLAMRLLAVTAGDAAQGRVTEADQVVGTTTVGGTLGFVLPLVFLVPSVVFGAAVVVVMLVGAAVSTRPAVRRVWANPRLLVVGRTLIAVAALVALPSFVTTIADIL